MHLYVFILLLPLGHPAGTDHAMPIPILDEGIYKLKGELGISVCRLYAYPLENYITPILFLSMVFGT